jgi:hypothetical protein
MEAGERHAVLLSRLRLSPVAAIVLKQGKNFSRKTSLLAHPDKIAASR